MRRKRAGNLARPYGGRRRRGGFWPIAAAAAPFAIKLAGKAIKGIFGRKKRSEEGEGRRRRTRGRKRLGMGRVTAGPLA